MKRFLLAVTLLLAVAGCQAGGDSAATESDAVVAEAPSLILEFTDQKTAYQCPSCKMVFDGPGECSMNDGTLEEMTVTYNCPEDATEVFDMAGTCPTHDATVVATLTPVHMHEEGMDGEAADAADAHEGS